MSFYYKNINFFPSSLDKNEKRIIAATGRCPPSLKQSDNGGFLFSQKPNSNTLRDMSTNRVIFTHFLSISLSLCVRQALINNGMPLYKKIAHALSRSMEIASTTITAFPFNPDESVSRRRSKGPKLSSSNTTQLNESLAMARTDRATTTCSLTGED